jgi:hypothetical protein
MNKSNGRYTTRQFIRCAREVHGHKYIYTKVKYKNSRTPIIIICRKHGEFRQRPKDHLYGKGCRKCYGGISKKANKWLDQFEGIKREKPIKAGKTTYVVDGIDRENNTIYEFWGDFWHGNPKVYDPDEINPVTKTTFGSLYEKTQDKIKDLKDAGFKVISIWESEWDGRK